MLLGAQRVVSGVSGGPPERCWLELRLERSDGNGEGVTERFGEGPLFDVLDEASRWLLERLSLGELPEEARGLIFSTPAATTTAVEYFVKAMMAVREERAGDAIHYATQAVEYDRRFPPALRLRARVELRLEGESQLRATRRLRVLAELSRLAGDLRDQAETELTLGLIAHLRGAPEAAWTRYETSLALAHERGDPYGLVAAMTLICDHYLSRPAPRDLPPEALERLRVAQARSAAEWQQLILEELERLGDVIAQISAAHKLALIHEELGDEQAAWELHQRTLAAAERVGSRRGQVTAHMFLGQWYRRQGRMDEALASTQRCLELAGSAARPSVRIALADLYEGLSPPRLADALAQLEQARTELDAGGDLATQLVCLRNVARLRRELGRRDDALAALREAIDLAHALESPETAALRQMLAEWTAP